MEILIISGLSGAGKSKAASYLEDMGFYIVDNMPAAMILKFAEFCAGETGTMTGWRWCMTSGPPTPSRTSLRCWKS